MFPTMKKIMHTLRTKGGAEYTGRILYTKTEDAHRMNRNQPQDFLLFLFEIQEKKVWLDNYNTHIKYGKGNKWFYEINKEAERKIKNALK